MGRPPRPRAAGGRPWRLLDRLSPAVVHAGRGCGFHDRRGMTDIAPHWPRTRPLAPAGEPWPAPSAPRRPARPVDEGPAGTRAAGRRQEAPSVGRRSRGRRNGGKDACVGRAWRGDCPRGRRSRRTERPDRGGHWSGAAGHERSGPHPAGPIQWGQTHKSRWSSCVRSVLSGPRPEGRAWTAAREAPSNGAGRTGSQWSCDSLGFSQVFLAKNPH